MPKPAQNVQPPQSTAPLNPTHLNALADKFKELAQTLLTFSQTDPSEAVAEVPQKTKLPDQTRCYRVPGFIVRHEQESLAQHHANDLLGLLRKARDDFQTTAVLLQNFHEDNVINGFMVQQIGESLDYPIQMLNDLCGIFADYKPQEPEPCSG